MNRTIGGSFIGSDRLAQYLGSYNLLSTQSFGYQEFNGKDLNLTDFSPVLAFNSLQTVILSGNKPDHSNPGNVAALFTLPNLEYLDLSYCELAHPTNPINRAQDREYLQERTYSLSTTSDYSTSSEESEQDKDNTERKENIYKHSQSQQKSESDNTEVADDYHEHESLLDMIDWSSIEPCTSLHTLILRGNNLSHIPFAMLKVFPFLQKLDISDNLFEDISFYMEDNVDSCCQEDGNQAEHRASSTITTITDYFPFLTALNASGNKLRYVFPIASSNGEHTISINFPALTELDLSSNLIVEFIPSTSKGISITFPLLASLDISKNRIEELNRNYISGFATPILSAINLEDNPIRKFVSLRAMCTCKHLETIKISTPKGLANSFTDVNNSRFVVFADECGDFDQIIKGEFASQRYEYTKKILDANENLKLRESREALERNAFISYNTEEDAFKAMLITLLPQVQIINNKAIVVEERERATQWIDPDVQGTLSTKFLPVYE